MRTRIRLTLAAMCNLLPGLSWAATVRVPQDYTLIQQACDAAQSGDTILLGALNDTMYMEEVLIDGKSFVFRSVSGPLKTQIRRRFIFYSAGPGDSTRFIGIRWKTGSHTPALLFQEGEYVVENCVFDSSNDCSNTSFPHYTIDVGSLASVRVTGCTFVAQPRAIKSDGGSPFQKSSVRVSSCVFERSCDYALYPDGGYLSVAYCCFWQNAEDADSSVDWGAGNMPFDPLLRKYDYSLQPGSPCIDAGDPALPLDPDGSRADIGAYIPYRTAGTLYVSTSGNDDSATGSLSQPFRSLGIAYLCAIPQDTLSLLPGTFQEHVTLDRTTIHLTSTGGADLTRLEAVVAGRPVIDFRAGFANRSTISRLTIADVQNASAIRVRDKAGTRIEYCSVVGHSTGLSGGLFIDSDSVTVRGCRFSDNSGGAIYGQSANAIVIDSCEISGNASGGAGSAIVLSNCRSVSITRNLIYGNTYNDDIGGPVYLYAVREGVVQSNTVTNNSTLDFDALGAGLVVTSCTTLSIENNLISFNQGFFGLVVNGGPVGIYNAYNNIYGQWVPGIAGLTPGPGHLSADPLLDQNFAPTENSPCIDAGDPASPVPSGGGGRIDIGAFEYLQPVGVTDPAGGQLPEGFALEPNQPNPFNSSTRIAYVLPHAAHARLTVHDVLGRLVAILADHSHAAGRHVVTWEGRDQYGRDLGSGVYFYTLTAGGRTEIRKLLVVK